MADRKLTITFDPATMSYKYTTEGFHVDDNFSDYERTESYENTLINGVLTAVDPLGNVTEYTDGCHLVREESGRLTTKSKPEYVEWNGRPGSENED
jgi:hypothetical protein